MLRSLAYAALAIRIRGDMVVANALYIVASVALWWFSAVLPDWFWQPVFVFFEVLLAWSSMGTIVALLISRLIPIPFLKKHVRILTYIGIAFVVVLNTWYSLVSIAAFASEVPYDPYCSGDMGEIALIFFYPALALMNIVALVLVRVKRRMLLLEP